jgi:hypothetical protein
MRKKGTDWLVVSSVHKAAFGMQKKVEWEGRSALG